jgi:hypothetical protein
MLLVVAKKIKYRIPLMPAEEGLLIWGGFFKKLTEKNKTIHQ